MPNEPEDAFFITTAIPYVNAAPHVGFAMEMVLADVLARHHRQRGRDVYFLTGSDENSLKNVQAAEAAGIGVARFVERNAAAFYALRETLNLSFDDFIRTASDPRHRAGAVKLWRACLARGDIYRAPYRGRYCVGCEQFYADSELDDGGRCPEHGVAPELIEEDNYFFRLSRYQAPLRALLESGRLRVTPAEHRGELLAWLDRGLQDFSVSRSTRRARGWGIPVPDDPEQVMYVWFDALGNYINALDYADEGPKLARYWAAEAARVHVIGKGITRFHALYWPALLLSAGLPPPSTIVVHGYLTVDGRKIGKSLGNAIAPARATEACGVDALRYYLCRHVRVGRDGDFSVPELLRARDGELADGLGNLLQRTLAMIVRYRGGRVPDGRHDPGPFAAASTRARGEIERAFDAYRPDLALAEVASLCALANKYVVERAPWRTAKQPETEALRARLSATLYNLAEVLRLIAYYLAPVIPRAAEEVRARLGLDSSAGAPRWDRATRWGQLAPGARVAPGPALFPKT